jgi:hypothetical protein
MGAAAQDVNSAGDYFFADARNMDSGTSSPGVAWLRLKGFRIESRQRLGEYATEAFIHEEAADHCVDRRNNYSDHHTRHMAMLAQHSLPRKIAARLEPAGGPR